jgi:hypothetical protein
VSLTKLKIPLDERVKACVPSRITSRIQDQGRPSVVYWRVARCRSPGRQDEVDEPPAGSDLAASDSAHEAHELSATWQENSAQRRKQIRLSFDMQANCTARCSSGKITRSFELRPAFSTTAYEPSRWPHRFADPHGVCTDGGTHRFGRIRGSGCVFAVGCRPGAHLPRLRNQ